MRKLMAVAALGRMVAVVGCDKNKEKDTTTTTSTSSDPKKMSLSEKPSSSSCSECTGAAKTAK